MADFKTAGLCGANPDFNSIMTAGVDLKDSIKSKLGAGFSSASDLASLAESKISTLTSSVSSMIPELPEIPDVSLQAELTELLAFDLTTPTGLATYTSKLSSITSSFGGSLTGAGLSLDSLISDASSALSGGVGDLCGAVPNFKLPSGSAEAIAQAGEVLQATEEGVPEEQATIFENTDFNNVYTPNQPTSISLQSANEASSSGQTASTNTSTGLGTTTTI